MADVVVQDNGRRVQFTASAGQTNFLYPFLIFEASDLLVFQTPVGDTPNDQEDILVLSIDYLVTGVGDQEGGTVILNVPATAGDIITIESNVQQTQDVDFQVGGKFQAATINRVIDKLTILVQQNNSLLNDRGLVYDATDPLDQSTDRGDNRLPQLPANTGAGIPLWTKNSNGDLIAGVCQENPDCSTLRTELSSTDPVTNGASIVGYFDPVAVTQTTVKLALDGLLNTVFSDIFTTGDIKWTYKIVADSGFVLLDDGSIGSAASGATTRANADTNFLFAVLWDNISDTFCPVSGGRGANAAADFAANKNIRLPQVLGRTMGILGQSTFTETFTGDSGTDELTIVASATSTSFLENIFVGTKFQVSSSGTLPSPLLPATDFFVTAISGSAFKVSTNTANAVLGTFIDILTNGTGTHTVDLEFDSRSLAQPLGEQVHLISTVESAAHNHDATPGGTGKFLIDGDAGPAEVFLTGTTASVSRTATQIVGSSVSHNIMQPSSYMNAMIKL